MKARLLVGIAVNLGLALLIAAVLFSPRVEPEAPEVMVENTFDLVDEASHPPGGDDDDGVIGLSTRVTVEVGNSTRPP